MGLGGKGFLKIYLNSLKFFLKRKWKDQNKYKVKKEGNSNLMQKLSFNLNPWRCANIHMYMPLQEVKQLTYLYMCPGVENPVLSVSIFVKVKTDIKLVSILIWENFLETAVLMLTLKIFLPLFEIIRLFYSVHMLL